MTAITHWSLGNGESIPFEIYGRNDGWNDVPGLYIFSFIRAGCWRALYIGQAASFQERLPNHERLEEAVRNGATHIHVMVVGQQAKRNVWERMLIQTHQPPLNTQHRNGLSRSLLP